MGDFKVRPIKDNQDRSTVIDYILDDIKAMDILINEGLLDKSYPKVGAEQEMCVIRKDLLPAKNALDLLDAIQDEHYTNELALFNMEINLDPHVLTGRCFSTIEQELLDLLAKGHKAADDFDSKILLTGILPTLKYRHLKFDYMTPIKRYQTLSEVLLGFRKSDFEIYMQGVDDVIMSLGSVLFEACNTSFQLHLQIHPDEFVDQYNWSQMISGPVLATGVNSPLLFGKELWAESRIDLFKQSLDTRTSKNQMRTKMPRVFFGSNWIKNSASDIWKEQVSRFPVLLTSDNFERSTDALKEGRMPDLRAALLHNGTSYTWNRLCYGNFAPSPHLRIECRYLPSGPSVVDEIATFMFWIGLMNNRPENWNDLMKKQDFRATKNNFIKAARYGLNIGFNWYGETIPAQKLILDELIPMAEEGLKKRNVDQGDIDKYLSIIQKRTASRQTGAEWLITNYRRAQEKFNNNAALKYVTAYTLDYQNANIPVHEWKPIDVNHYFHQLKDHHCVEDYMTTDIFTMRNYNNLALAQSILDWRTIHHIPVEDDDGNLVGMLTDGIIEEANQKGLEPNTIIEDIMIKDVITVSSKETIGDAKSKMKANGLSGIPVVFESKLLGIITEHDLAAYKATDE